MKMITIGEYQPLAGTGKNTIRRYSDKYGPGMLRVGRKVDMFYGPDIAMDTKPDAAEVLAAESLVVSSLVTASFDQIVEHHLKKNHGGFKTKAEAVKFFLGCYPDLDKDTIGDAKFMAIYFQ